MSRGSGEVRRWAALVRVRGLVRPFVVRAPWILLCVGLLVVALTSCRPRRPVMVSSGTYATQVRGRYGPPCSPPCSPGFLCDYGRCLPYCGRACPVGWGCVAPDTCEPLCNPPCERGAYCGEDRRCHAGAPRARTAEPSQEWRPPPPTTATSPAAEGARPAGGT